MNKPIIVKYKPNFVDFTLIGISSHENDYRLSWSFNEQFRLGFVRGNSFTTGDGKEFTCFSHLDDYQKIMLVSNRCDNGFLLEKYKNLDFILKFDVPLDETEITDWLQNLKKASLISAAFVIPVNKQVSQLLERLS